MNRKTNLILLVLVVLVAGYMIFFRTPSDTNQPVDTATDANKKLLTFASADVSKVAITPADDKPIVIEKKGDNWQLTQPVDARAEKYAVDDLVSAITDLKSRGQVDLGGPKAADAGLDQPRYRIELTGKDGKTAKLVIGSRSPLGDTMVVKLEGNAKADVVPADLYKKLSEPANKLRDPKLTDISSTDIKQVAITSGGTKITLQKTGDAWQMTEPLKMPVEATDATDITSQLANLRAVDFVNDDGSSANRYQLADPQLVVWFTKEAPTTQPSASASTQPAGLTLKFGRYDGPQKQNVYAQFSNSPAIVKVAGTSLSMLRKKPYELRDRKVADIDPATVSRITLTTDITATTQPTTREASKTSLTVVRNDAVDLQGPPMPATLPTSQPATAPASQPASRWVLADDKKTSIEDSKVTDLLQVFKPLRATKYIESIPAEKINTTYTLTLSTVAAGGATATQEFRIIDRGENDSPVGQYNGLSFELDRDVLGKLKLK